MQLCFVDEILMIVSSLLSIDSDISQLLTGTISLLQLVGKLRSP